MHVGSTRALVKKARRWPSSRSQERPPHRVARTTLALAASQPLFFSHRAHDMVPQTATSPHTPLRSLSLLSAVLPHAAPPCQPRCSGAKVLRRPPSSLPRCLRAAVEEAKLGRVEGPGTPPSRRRRTEAQTAAERDDHTGVVRVLETAQEAVRASAPGMAEDATCAALWGKLSNLGTRVAEFEGRVPRHTRGGDHQSGRK